MILNTGSRTDIPAYYSDWFYNRIKERHVLVRNPYYPSQVTKYRLSPDVVDAMVFCTKNPEPMIARLKELAEYSCFWFVTITPYGKDIEPHVPDKEMVLQSFKELSRQVGIAKFSWRYDPIFVTGKYSVEYHIEQFEQMADSLAGYTNQCVVSFIDLYEKTKRNFQEARAVSINEQEQLIKEFSRIAVKNHMQIHLCCENKSLVRENVDADGCMTKEVLESAIGCKLDVPKKKYARQECNCLLGADIGMYNTCGHGCLYCYANYDRKTVIDNKSEKAQAKFASGTSQHTLQKNRINALKVAYALLTEELTQSKTANAFDQADFEKAVTPLTSLKSKSEKAMGKLSQESWQYKMLDENVKALNIALALLANKI